MVVKKAKKQDILNCVSILNIAQDYGIKLELISSGNFTHRCKCPSKDHKHGSERTSSLYIDSKNNNFYCFGCSATSNVIDFYMMCEDTSFSQALKDMSELVSPDKIGKSCAKNTQNIYPTLLRLSVLIRKYLLKNKEDANWIYLVMKKADYYILKLERDDVKSAKRLYNNIEKKLLDRYGDL